MRGNRQRAAVAVEGCDDITLLDINHAAQSLTLAQRLLIPDLSLPTAVQACDLITSVSEVSIGGGHAIRMRCVCAV